MKNENLKQEEKFDYDKFVKTHSSNKLINLISMRFILMYLIIFLIPKNVLSDYPFLKYFTDFMGEIFPNIKVFASRSEIGEVVALYTSIMWIIGIVFLIFLTKAYIIQFMQFFGVGKYKDNPIIASENMPFIVKRFINIKIFLSFIVISLLTFYITYIYYTGNIIDGNFIRFSIKSAIQSKIGTLIITLIFNGGIIFLITSLTASTTKIIYLLGKGK